MFIIRSVAKSDIDDLYELSKLVHFINLPPDIGLIEQKVNSSVVSFKNPSPDKSKNYYIFVLEDLSKNKVIGASMIHGQHGTDEEPHYYLEVGQEYKFSETINTGFIHGTLSFDFEHNGFTEIGGLIVHPKYRGNENKLGKQLSFIRFLYIGLYQESFTPEIHSELMPPLDEDGNSPLWEAIGRRFMNMDYHEADRLSRTNKEFIVSLWPSGKIYQTLLPIEARNAIGKVGRDTLPVKKMLEAVGFKYTKQVDPFDGGPHYRAKTSEIKPVKELFEGALVPTSGLDKNKTTPIVVKIEHPDHHFFAKKLNAIITEKKGNTVIEVDSKEIEMLKFFEPKTKVHATYI